MTIRKGQHALWEFPTKFGGTDTKPVTVMSVREDIVIVKDEDGETSTALVWELTPAS